MAKSDIKFKRCFLVKLSLSPTRYHIVNLMGYNSGLPLCSASAVVPWYWSHPGRWCWLGGGSWWHSPSVNSFYELCLWLLQQAHHMYFLQLCKVILDAFWTDVCLFLHILHWLASVAFVQHSLCQPRHASKGGPRSAQCRTERERERERDRWWYISCLFAIKWYILIFVRLSLVVGWENDLLHGSFLQAQPNCPNLLRNDIEITRLSWFQSRKYQDTADLEGIQGPDWYPFGVCLEHQTYCIRWLEADSLLVSIDSAWWGVIKSICGSTWLIHISV